MRQPGPYGKEFMEIVNSIATIVDAVAQESAANLAGSHIETPSKPIIIQLSTVKDEMKSIGKEMVMEAPTKSLKQKMASCSYEIARHVKELLNLL
jgi:hypothetical protein